MKQLTLERFFRGLIWLALGIVVLVVMMRFSTLVAYAAIALIFSYILEPFVNRMQASGLPRIWGIFIVIATLGVALAWVSTTVFPIIANQLILLTKQLNIDTLNEVVGEIEQQILGIVPMLPEGFLRENLIDAAENLFDTDAMPGTLGSILDIFTDLFWGILVIPFATFFFLKDGSRIRRSLLKVVPNRYFETTLTLIDKVERRLGFYFKSVGIQSVLVAISSWAFLSLAGLNNALSVGIAAGVANVIPYFGPIIGYILSIIVAIFETGDFSLVVFCILAIMATQIIDNMVFQPFIFSQSADLHPLIVLFVVLIGAELAGIIGMLFAVPIAASIKITFNQLNWSLKNYHVFRARG